MRIRFTTDARPMQVPRAGAHNPAMPHTHRLAPGPERVDESRSWSLWTAAATRALEERARAELPPGTLMRRAGESVARLARALAPHARRAWVAAGPGGNGGDGLHVAADLQHAGLEVVVTLVADAGALAAEPAQGLQRAREAGCRIGPDLPETGADVSIDALLGLGASRPPATAMRAAIEAFNSMAGLRLCVDMPSGLQADTGALLGAIAARGHATLGLLTLKPGLFTGAGREHAGQVWFDDLACTPAAGAAPAARLPSAADVAAALPARSHDRHKGSFGDVVVVGGAPGMLGAARLAAQGALCAGPGRVFVSPLDPDQALADPQHPEWLWMAQAWLPGRRALESDTVVCGCGGGWAVAQALPDLLARAARMVLDADALNALVRDESLRRQLRARQTRGQATVLTPHPLEAARLLGTDTARVQSDRLQAADALARAFGAVVLLKGSGSVVACEGRLPVINPTGSASLSVGGTGDVLAGWIGGLWAASRDSGLDDASTGWQCALAAAWLHGQAGARPGGSPARAGTLAEDMARLAEVWRARTGADLLSAGRACGQ